MDRVVILASGTWEDDEQARRLAASASFVIAADGGFVGALRSAARVDLVVGDLDSIDAAGLDLLSRGSPALQRHSTTKDASDLELALDVALERRPARIDIVGALGGRLDHALTNVHLLERGIDAGTVVRLIDGHQTVAVVAARHGIEDARLGDSVSLIPLSSTARVTTAGLRYPLQAERLVRSASRGVSNVVASLPASVDVSEGRLIVIHTSREVRA